MVSQIERGESSPTIATLWNLTRALQVDFAGLLEASETVDRIDVLRARDVPVIDSKAAQCTIAILSPPEDVGGHEVYDISFAAGGALISQPHTPGTREQLTVLEGTVVLTSGTAEDRLSPGDTARYAADVSHAIAAPDGAARVFLIIEADGLYKRERMITSPQGGEIRVGARNVINLCANNYLGLADHPDLIAAAKTVMDDKGYGMASVARVRTVNVAKEDLNDVKHELGLKEGFDVGLEMSGNQQALDQMVEALVMGGKIALLGIPPGKSPVDWSRIVFKAITIKGVYGREMFETWYKMIAMLQNGLDWHTRANTCMHKELLTCLMGQRQRIDPSQMLSRNCRACGLMHTGFTITRAAVHAIGRQRLRAADAFL
eukprot:g20650.t1